MPIDSSCQAESKRKVFNKKNHYQIERDGDVYEEEHKEDELNLLQ